MTNLIVLYDSDLIVQSLLLCCTVCVFLCVYVYMCGVGWGAEEKTGEKLFLLFCSISIIFTFFCRISIYCRMYFLEFLCILL